MYEIIGPGGYKFMVGRMGWTIAKIWQGRNATTPFLTEQEKQTIMEKFHKSKRNVEQAVKDTWARFTRKEGRGVHVVRRDPRPLRFPLRKTRHRWSTTKPNSVATPLNSKERSKTADQGKVRRGLDGPPSNPTVEELLKEAKKRKVRVERSLFEEVRQKCVLPLEQLSLPVGKHIIVHDGKVLVEIERFEKSIRPLGEASSTSHSWRYVVWIHSSIPSLAGCNPIMVGGSTALEAMTMALRKLEDELCPSV